MVNSNRCCEYNVNIFSVEISGIRISKCFTFYSKFLLADVSDWIYTSILRFPFSYLSKHLPNYISMRYIFQRRQLRRKIYFWESTNQFSGVFSSFTTFYHRKPLLSKSYYDIFRKLTKKRCCNWSIIKPLWNVTFRSCTIVFFMYRVFNVLHIIYKKKFQHILTYPDIRMHTSP